MREKPLTEIAESYGLIVETVRSEGEDDVLRVLKGVNAIFVGTDEAARTFLDNYEQERPGLMDLSMYGYRE